MSILVLNAGSSSLKFGLFDATVKETLASGMIDLPGQLEEMPEPSSVTIVGHRIVNGGTGFPCGSACCGIRHDFLFQSAVQRVHLPVAMR